ncbi:MAG: hypothetical protein HY702_01360, partial [Gemmatimonadetes bacterium]|nr:hypothetical protein [Gemmatimonadota bacterium]
MRRPSFWARVREARLFRILLLYLAACWVILQVAALLQNQLLLPKWVTPLAILLLLIGLVIIFATAWVQTHPAARAGEGEAPRPWEIDLKGLTRSLAQRRLPHPTWARAILGGVFAFSLLFGAAGLYVLLTARGTRISPVMEAVAGPGPGIAVLPFRVVGPDLELWREGVVDLLSTNLDGAAGLRKIDPRTVLSKWRSEIGEAKEAPDPEAALRVARDAGATYAVMGSMVGSRGELRITAEVYDLGTGKLQGTAQAGGSPDSVLALIDRLSIELLRAGLAREPTEVRQLAVSRITTSSLPALKAYLAGEQAYRRNRFEEAIPHFTRAVEADSTFALALSRLSKIYGWLEAFSPRTIEYGQRAARFAEPLPEREALLLRGGAEMDEGRLAAIRMLEELTARYPDHVEGWYALGEAYFHIGAQGLHPPEKFRHASRRAVELDPTFEPAYIHLMNDAFWQHDSAGAAELIARYQQIDPASPEVGGQLLAYALAWGDSGSKERARLALDTAQTQVVTAAWLSLLSATDFSNELMEVGEELLEPRHPSAARNFGKWAIAYAYAVRGKVREAREAVRKGSAILGEEAYTPPNSRAYLGWHLAGATDSTGARRAAQVLASDPAPWDGFLVGALAAQEKR